jgi:hypothetical protein
MVGEKHSGESEFYFDTPFRFMKMGIIVMYMRVIS